MPLFVRNREILQRPHVSPNIRGGLHQQHTIYSWIFDELKSKIRAWSGGAAECATGLVINREVVPLQVLRSSWNKSPSATTCSSTSSLSVEGVPCSYGSMFKSCEESRRPRPKGSRISSSSGVATRGQQLGPREEAFLASVRRDLGQREEKRRGARTGGSSPIFL